MVRLSYIALVLIVTSGAAPTKREISVPNSSYGINAHVPTDAELAKIQAAGIAWARVDFSWNRIEPTRGIFEWGIYDTLVENANARNIFLHAMLVHAPQWANGGRGSGYPAKDSSDWKNFVRAVVDRYKRTVKYWGVWNEPDIASEIASPAMYVREMLIPAAEVIHESDAEGKVCAPELGRKSNWLFEVLNAAKDYIDVVTVNDYEVEPDGRRTVHSIMNKFDGRRRSSQEPNYKAVLQRTGVFRLKPFWCTETGWPTSSGGENRRDIVSEQEQARLYVDLLKQIHKHNWIDKVFFYELRDDSTYGVAKWGILKSDLSEKPAYHAYRNHIVNHLPHGNVDEKCRHEDTKSQRITN